MNRLYILILFAIFCNYAIAQEVNDTTQLNAGVENTPVKSANKQDKKERKLPHLFWGFKAGAGQLGWAFENKNMELENDLAITGGIYFELQTTKWLSFEVGANYTMMSGSVSLEGYSSSIETTDDEGDSYTHLIDASYANEEFDASLLEVPIAIKLICNPGNWKFYLKPGVAYTMALSSSYNQQAKIAISGYYPEENITFTDLSQHGYFTGTTFKSSGEMAITTAINPFIGAGIVFPGKRGNLFIEGKYYPGAMDFSDGSGNGSLFEGPMDNQEIGDYNFESLTEEAGEITLEGFMVEIGFRF